MVKRATCLLIFMSVFVFCFSLPASAASYSGYVSVNISSYDAFRSATFGNGYDVDYSYGVQCWDGVALFWHQLGMSLQTGNGQARGCWTLKRNENAGSQFDLIYNKEEIKRGDIVVLDYGTYGHIAFADADYSGTYLSLYGQNQNYTGEPFNTCNWNLRTFLGAFRYKGWGAIGTLDVNGWLDDNNKATNVEGYGTFDVYINGKCVADNVSDYYNTALAVGTSFEIKDIKPTTGHLYSGAVNNTISGTISKGTVTEVRLYFQTAQNLGNNFYAYINHNNSFAENNMNGRVVNSAYSEWAFSYDPRHVWQFIRITSGEYAGNYKIISAYNGDAFDAVDFGTADGTALGLMPSNDSCAERWYIGISPVFSLFCTINTAYSSLAVDAAGSNGMVHLWTAGITNENQDFYIIKLSELGISYSKPAAPTEPTIYIPIISGNHVSVSWKDSPLIGKFDERMYNVVIYKGASTSGEKVFEKSTTDRSCETNLQDGTYTVAVKAINTKYPDLSTTAYSTFSIVTQFTVSFNANTTDSVSNMPGNQTKRYGRDMMLSEDEPKRTGYTFLGWASTSTAISAEYWPGSMYENDQDVTLYALWKRNMYQVSFDANTTDSVSNMPENQTKTYGEDLTLSTKKPTREGYTFIRWSLRPDAYSGNLYPGDVYSADDDVILYAMWEKNGTAMSAGAGRSLSDGDYFICTALNESYALDIAGTDVPASEGSNVQLFGIGRKSYDAWTLTYLNNGFYAIKQYDTQMALTVAGGSTEWRANIQVNSYTGSASQQWSIEGTSFGYRLKARCSGFSVDITGGNVANYTNIQQYKDNLGDKAGNQSWVFIPYTYRVSYDANTAVAVGNMPENQKKIHDVDLSLSANKPTRTGYAFQGWATSATAITPEYQPGGSYTQNKAVTLYAVWVEVNPDGQPGHTPGGWQVTKPATCTEEGKEEQRCVTCGALLATRTIAKTAHTPGSWKTTKAATCTETGTKEKRCKVCNAVVETATIAKKAHTPGEWTVTKEATCAEEGKKEQRCTVCGTVIDTETIAKTAHTPGSWKTTKAATCTETGIKEKRCKVCNAVVETATIAKKEHTPGPWRVTKAPTAKKNGKKERCCTVCGTVLESGTVIPMALPAGLQRIEEEAFAGTAYEAILILDGCTFIGSKAFADCQNLICIAIPESCTGIAGDAFQGVTGLTVCGKEGSYAEFYAEKHGFTFVVQ